MNSDTFYLKTNNSNNMTKDLRRGIWKYYKLQPLDKQRPFSQTKTKKTEACVSQPFFINSVECWPIYTLIVKRKPHNS